jgi:exonuclease SbcD
LIVAGDMFDSGSPPGSALAMFYGFLADARRRLPELCVVVVAGNHDSPARLAAPDPVLRGLGVWIVGSVPYEGTEIAPARMVVPVVRGGRVLGRIVAMPFLRGADLPAAAQDPLGDGHARGARRVYDAALAHAHAVRSEGEPIVVTGHFAAAGARMSRDSERLLVGGIDGTLPIDVIDAREVAYVALGHLHLAQQVPAAAGATAEARYSGSPIPLSFSERDFEHEVRFVTLEGTRVVRSEPVRVPRSVPFVRLPASGLLDRGEALASIGEFPAREAATSSVESWPWVEVRVRALVDERDVLEAIEAAAEARALHLVRVVVERPEAEQSVASEARTAASLDVRDVLVARWAAEHGAAPPDEVLEALREALVEARVRLEQRRARGVEMESPAAIVRPASVRPASVAARRRELED